MFNVCYQLQPLKTRMWLVGGDRSPAALVAAVGVVLVVEEVKGSVIVKTTEDSSQEK